MKKYALFLALMLSGLAMQAQKGPVKSFELGLMGGLSLYSGDLSPQEVGLYFQELNPAIGFFGRYNVGKRLSLRLGATFTKATGDDMRGGFETRGLNFRTNISEVALTGEYNIFSLGNPKGFHVAPYLFAGVGVYHFNPQGNLDGAWVDLQPLGTEGQGLPGYEKPYTLTQLNVPFGAGIKFHVNNTLTIGVEMGGRKLFTDHLDDVSYVEVNYLDILEGNGSLAARFSNPTLTEPSAENVIYRRGGDFLDWYYVGGVTLSFRIGEGSGPSGKGIGCPTF